MGHGCPSRAVGTDVVGDAVLEEWNLMGQQKRRGAGAVGAARRTWDRAVAVAAVTVTTAGHLIGWLANMVVE